MLLVTLIRDSAALQQYVTGFQETFPYTVTRAKYNRKVCTNTQE
jgi:hypothetical protein